MREIHLASLKLAMIFFYHWNTMRLCTCVCQLIRNMVHNYIQICKKASWNFVLNVDCFADWRDQEDEDWWPPGSLHRPWTPEPPGPHGEVAGVLWAGGQRGGQAGVWRKAGQQERYGIKRGQGVSKMLYIWVFLLARRNKKGRV